MKLPSRPRRGPRAQNERLAQNEIDHEFVGRKGLFTRREQWIAFHLSLRSLGPRGLEAHLPKSGQCLSSRTGGKQPPVSQHRRFVENTTGSVMSAFLGEPDKACAAFVYAFEPLADSVRRAELHLRDAEASTSPRGSACVRSPASSAASASMIAARACSKTRCPTWVRASLRVLRSSNRTLSRSSNSATRRLIRDFGTFNAREAAENPQLRTTAAKN